MQQTLIVIADISGSMEELGKAFLVRNALRFISRLPEVEEEKYADTIFRFFAWSDGIDEIYPDFDEVIHPQGKCDIDVLLGTINRLRGEPNPKCLLLSEGNFDYSHVKERPDIPCCGIVVGVDASLKGIEWFSGGAAFLGEEIHQVVEEFLHG
jgi:hypothetical protein